MKIRYRILKDIITMDLIAKAGDIGEQDVFATKYDDACKVWFDNHRYFFYLSKIKEFPDWFEEIKEEKPKEWEILKYWGGDKNSIHDYLKYKDEKGTGLSCEEVGCDIYSVKRLSDNEEFTIGDKLIEYNGEILTIDGFELRYDGTQMWVFTDKKKNYGMCISIAKKAKEQPVDREAFVWDNQLIIDCCAYLYNTRKKEGQTAIDMVNDFKKLKSTPKEQPKEERVEVTGICPINIIVLEKGYPGYGFTTSKPISPEKYEAIKKAIENVLNEAPNALFGKQAYERLFDQNQEIMEEMAKMYSERELLETEEKAFNGARKTHPVVVLKYDTFSDYKNSI